MRRKSANIRTAGRAVCERWRGVGWQHDFRMNNAAFAGVVMGQAVPLVHQLFTAPIGGSGHSGLALAPLDDLDGTMKNCRKNAPPFSAGYWPRRKVTDAQRVSLSGGGARGLGSAAPHRARRAQQPPAGRTTPATVYKCAIRTGDYSATSFLGAFSASSAAPGRRERAIRNALTSSPSMPTTAGKTASKMAPRPISRCVLARCSSLRFLFSKIYPLEQRGADREIQRCPACQGN